MGPVPGQWRDAGIRRQALENLALRPWTLLDARMVAAHGHLVRGFFGRVHTGRLDQAVFARIVSRLPDGVSELMTHPGYQDAALVRVRTRLRRERELEVALLRSPEARQSIGDARVTLVRHDLQPVLQPPVLQPVGSVVIQKRVVVQERIVGRESVPIREHVIH